MKSILVIAVVLSSILCSCALLFQENESIKIIDNYYVGWNDLVSNRQIVEKKSKDSKISHVIIGGYVFAVGHNKEFIIAKQRKLNSTLSTKYYIVDITQKLNKKILGPLSKEKFEEKKIQLGIKELEFDLVFEESP